MSAGSNELRLAIDSWREEPRVPQAKPWPWAILAADEEFVREYDDHLGFAEGFWLVRVADGSGLREPGSWRLVGEERDPRRWWALDIAGPCSFSDADAIARSLIAGYDLGRRDGI